MPKASHVKSKTGHTGIRSWLTPRRLRSWREYLTGYLMIFPAVFLIFLFGIFPVGFALYVSLHKWRLKRGDIIGLDNYTTLIGSLAYLMVFALAIGILIWAFYSFRKTRQAFTGQPNRFWLLNIPGLILAAAFLSFVRWTIVLAPHVLDIANLITGVEKTRELFIRLLGDAFNSPDVVQARLLMLGLIGASLLAVFLCLNFWRSLENLRNQIILATTWIGVGIGLILLYYVYSEMMTDYNQAVLTGVDPGIFPQLISIVSGIILLFIGWKIWQRAKDVPKTSHFIFLLLGAMIFIVGGWIMVGELPVIVAAGDPDLWVGLRATLFYALGTIPFQLGISLFLAVLLFQNLKGSQLFRIIFFLPYVTPTVASAAVFRQLFSNRLQAPVNSGLRILGLEPLQWLWEPKGIIQLLASHFGLGTIPDWAAGPSLALVSIMIYSIWVFVGYDTVIYLAGLGNISKEMSEAAEVDGANRWQIFRHITFPMLSPTTYFLTIISVIGTFKAFNHIWVMRLDAALGTVDTFSVVIFTEFYEKLRYGYASAMAFILFAIILILTYVNTRTQGAKVFYG
jgi:multiple sugar transport system permease protein